VPGVAAGLNRETDMARLLSFWEFPGRHILNGKSRPNSISNHNIGDISSAPSWVETAVQPAIFIDNQTGFIVKNSPSSWLKLRSDCYFGGDHE
jgi:hypothetical protein